MVRRRRGSFLFKDKAMKEEETARGRGGGGGEEEGEVVARAETRTRSRREAGTRKESCCGCARASGWNHKSLDHKSLVDSASPELPHASLA